MKRGLLILWLALPAPAQIPAETLNELLLVCPVASAPGTGWPDPTNLAGATCYAWYPVHGNYASSSGSATLSNWSATANLNLETKVAGTTGQPTLQTAALNSKDVLYFDGGDDYLTNWAFGMNNGCEYFIVMAVTNTASGQNTFFDSMTSGGGNRNVFWANWPNYQLYAGTLVTVCAPVTNKWMVFDAVFNGTTSGMYTNNTYAGDVNAGTGNQVKFTLGANYSLALPGKFVMAELVAFSSVLSTGNRSNVFCYLTNKYALAP